MPFLVTRVVVLYRMYLWTRRTRQGLPRRTISVLVPHLPQTYYNVTKNRAISNITDKATKRLCTTPATGPASGTLRTLKTAYGKGGHGAPVEMARVGDAGGDSAHQRGQCAVTEAVGGGGVGGLR